MRFLRSTVRSFRLSADEGKYSVNRPWSKSDLATLTKPVTFVLIGRHENREDIWGVLGADAAAAVVRRFLPACDSPSALQTASLYACHHFACADTWVFCLHRSPQQSKYCLSQKFSIVQKLPLFCVEVGFDT